MMNGCENCPVQIACARRISAAESDKANILDLSYDGMAKDEDVESKLQLLRDLAQPLLETDDLESDGTSFLSKYRESEALAAKAFDYSMEFREAVVEALEAHDTAISALHNYSELAQSRCVGPRTRKKYWLFGKEILFCTGARLPNV